MGEVKRYKHMTLFGNQCLCVSADDYDALIAETYLHEVRLADAYEALELLRAENIGMVAQRMAYAGEFPPDQDGLPDTGSIHQNIRKLRAENAELVAALKRIDGMVYDSWTNGATAGEIAYAALAKHRCE